MTSQPTFRNRFSALISSRAVHFLALLGLCAAYIQGPLTKIFDFQSAIAEMQHFGLQPASLFSIVVIVFELTSSAMVLSGFLRWIGAFALAGFTLLATFVALRFWELPPGMDRMMAANAFFEHLGLAGAFVIVAAADFTGSTKRQAQDGQAAIVSQTAIQSG